MFNKKSLFLCLVFLVCSFLVVGCGTPQPTGPDYTIEYTVGDLFASVSPDNENYWGPYSNGAFALEDGAIVFDCSVVDGYFTMDLKDKPSPVLKYKYAIVVMKSDTPVDAVNAHITFGNIGQSLTQWGITDLSTTYKTFVLDLEAAGVTAWGDPSHEPWPTPDIAMNQSTATVAKIYIDKIAFANPN